MWNKIKDKLPEDGEEVLVCIKGIENVTYYKLVRYDKHRKQFTYWNSYDDCMDKVNKKDIKGWMSIPSFENFDEDKLDKLAEDYCIHEFDESPDDNAESSIAFYAYKEGYKKALGIK